MHSQIICKSTLKYLPRTYKTHWRYTMSLCIWQCLAHVHNRYVYPPLILLGVLVTSLYHWAPIFSGDLLTEVTPFSGHSGIAMGIWTTIRQLIPTHILFFLLYVLRSLLYLSIYIHYKIHHISNRHLYSGESIRPQNKDSTTLVATLYNLHM